MGGASSSARTAKPFATLAIADLLGVPEKDRAEIRHNLGAGRPRGGSVGGLNHEPVGSNPLQYLDDLFSGYIAERRRTPREDVLTGLATATYPDGSVPPLLEVVRPATFLFGAGQETVTKLLSSAVQILGDRPELQDRLRADRKLIGPFIEEALRMESPTKVDFRLARKSTTLGGVPIKAGTVIMLCLGAANRDPRKFEQSQRVSLGSQERSRAHRLRPRHSHLCRGAAGQSRGPGDHQPAAGPNTGHHNQQGKTRTGWCAAIPLQADLPAARPARAAHEFTPAS